MRSFSLSSMLWLLLSIITITITITNVDATHEITIGNNCPYKIWPSIIGHSGSITLMNHTSYSSLNNQEAFALTLPNGWSGRIWARTNCDTDGRNCQTGSCGDSTDCRLQSPTTVAHLNLNGLYGEDRYEVSLIDGYNLPIQIRTIAGTYRRQNPDYYHCYMAGCQAELNATTCPLELIKYNHSGDMIGCKSPCQQYDTDQYCCRGNFYGQSANCDSTKWPIDYVIKFKAVCSDARNKPYDHTTNTFNCVGSPNTGFRIDFCFP